VCDRERVSVCVREREGERERERSYLLDPFNIVDWAHLLTLVQENAHPPRTPL
jgi:hypothetical protein